MRTAALLAVIVLAACARDRSGARRLVEEERRDAKIAPACEHPCGAECPDVRHDEKHCGACEVACEPGSRCVAGACTIEADSTIAPHPPTCTAGRRLAFHCASSRTALSIWGTDRYTDDSRVCIAAVHAGQLDAASAGDVAVEIRRGLSSYKGSTRNGLTSNPWGAWPCSYLFVGDRCADGVTRCDDTCTDLANDEWNCGACGRRCDEDTPCIYGRCEPGATDWVTTAVAFPCTAGVRHTMSCPPMGTVGSSIWGTDVYTNDSPICVSAVHAGKITLSGGGSVTIEILAGRSSYAGSTRNGVTSGAYGKWSCSYQFD